MKVSVYGFNRFDIVEGQSVTSRYKAAKEKIMEWGGEVIPETLEEIEDWKLDAQGRYLPEAQHA